MAKGSPSPRRRPSKRQLNRARVLTMWRQSYRVMDIVRDANVCFDHAKVSKLIKKFKEAEEEVLFQPRTGRPKTATASNVEKKVVKRVKDKRKLKVAQGEGYQIFEDFCCKNPTKKQVVSIPSQEAAPH